MSSFNIYSMNKSDVIACLHTNYQYMLRDYVEYLTITTKKDCTELQYRTMAEELIYNECVKHFRYGEYVTSAKDALDHVYRGDYKRIKEYLQEEKNRLANEEVRIALLRKKCEEKGLDFETENEKALRKIARAAGRRCIILTSSSLILALVFALLGIFIDSLSGIHIVFLVLGIAFPLKYIFDKIKKAIIG